ncbi:hypothetical protein J6590_020404 [Homalodisca vitripennis]|nr:hypothetical protein J6590_020404 [Homalodisca vitripennis]
MPRVPRTPLVTILLTYQTHINITFTEVLREEIVRFPSEFQLDNSRCFLLIILFQDPPQWEEVIANYHSFLSRPSFSVWWTYVPGFNCPSQ